MESVENHQRAWSGREAGRGITHVWFGEFVARPVNVGSILTGMCHSYTSQSSEKCDVSTGIHRVFHMCEYPTYGVLRVPLGAVPGGVVLEDLREAASCATVA